MGVPLNGIAYSGPLQTKQKDVLLLNTITKGFSCAFVRVTCAMQLRPVIGQPKCKCHFFAS